MTSPARMRCRRMPAIATRVTPTASIPIPTSSASSGRRSGTSDSAAATTARFARPASANCTPPDASVRAVRRILAGEPSTNPGNPTAGTVNGHTFAFCANTGVTAAEFGHILANPAAQINTSGRRQYRPHAGKGRHVHGRLRVSAELPAEFRRVRRLLRHQDPEHDHVVEFQHDRQQLRPHGLGDRCAL